MRWACVVIDLQRDLCLDPRRSELVDASLPAIQRLIRQFDEHELPVYYTKFELEPDDPQFARFGDRYCVRGTPGCEFIPQISPREDQVVAKTKHSAFFGTDLDQRLATQGVSGVVLAGLQTQICILTTAADAYHRGLEVVVAVDAVISSRDDVRLEAVEWIDRYVGKASTVDDFTATL